MPVFPSHIFSLPKYQSSVEARWGAKPCDGWDTVSLCWLKSSDFLPVYEAIRRSAESLTSRLTFFNISSWSMIFSEPHLCKERCNSRMPAHLADVCDINILLSLADPHCISHIHVNHSDRKLISKYPGRRCFLSYLEDHFDEGTALQLNT